MKYYYQHDPTLAPYAYSNVAGFAQHLDAGSQVASITNTQTIRPNLSVSEVLGILREKAYARSPAVFATVVRANRNACDQHVWLTYFPGISIVDLLGLFSPTTRDGRSVNCNF